MNGGIAFNQALIAAQSEMPAVEKTAKANYGMYATLDSLIAKTRPILNKHGLAILQFPSITDGQPTLTTVILHGESGGHMEYTMPLLLGKTTMQDLGSAITYAKRYAWSAALGIAADDDDDGTVASPTNQPRARRGAEPEPEPEEADPAAITYLTELLVAEGVDPATIAKGFTAARRANRGALHPDWVSAKIQAAIARQDAEVESETVTSRYSDEQPDVEDATVSLPEPVEASEPV
jgi:hypothetical protein